MKPDKGIIAVRENSPGGCGGPSVLLPCNHRVQSP